MCVLDMLLFHVDCTLLSSYMLCGLALLPGARDSAG